MAKSDKIADEHLINLATSLGAIFAVVLLFEITVFPIISIFLINFLKKEKLNKVIMSIMVIFIQFLLF